MNPSNNYPSNNNYGVKTASNHSSLFNMNYDVKNLNNLQAPFPLNAQHNPGKIPLDSPKKPSQ